MLAQKTIKYLTVFSSLALANALAGCGKKGPPEAPPGSIYEFPGGYPHPNEAGERIQKESDLPEGRKS